MRTVGGIEFDIGRIVSDFNSRVDYAEMRHIPLKKIPKTDRELLIGCSHRFMSPEAYNRLEHIMSMGIIFDNGDFINGLIYPTVYPCGDSEISLYFFEHNKDGDMIGRAELRYNYSNPSIYFKDKPFIGYIATEDMGKACKAWRSRTLPGKRKD